MTSQLSGPALVVPFMDLRRIHEPLVAELTAAFAELTESGAFTNGPDVAIFERAFADYCGGVECVGVSSGLDGLVLALLAAGLEPGDEVIVPAQTFVATVAAVELARGAPVLVDVDPPRLRPGRGGNRRRRDRTDAVPAPRAPVRADGRHLGARRPCRAPRHRSDRGRVSGARRVPGRRPCGHGRRGRCLQLLSGKEPGRVRGCGCGGDAGRGARRDRPGPARARPAWRSTTTRRGGTRPGSTRFRRSCSEGSFRCSTAGTRSGASAALFYSEALAGVGDLVLPNVPAGSDPVWHLYVVRTADPARLAASLADRGVGSGRHYPDPVHLSRAYRHLGAGEGSFPVAEALARECLSLPIFPGITEAELAAVADAVRGYFDRAG